jgi:hypothetical protein
MYMAKYVKIRCPSVRPHRTNPVSGIVYDLCGSLIGGYNKEDTEDDFVCFCPVCHKFWNVIIDFYGRCVLRECSGMIDFTDTIKVVE